MRLQTKFMAGLLGVFLFLALISSIATIHWVNRNAIQEAQNRVNLQMQAATDIFNMNQTQVHSVLATLAQSPQFQRFLSGTPDLEEIRTVRERLEAVRVKHGQDILTLVDEEGRVRLRSRPPFNSGDQVIDDGLINRVFLDRSDCLGTILLNPDRLKLEGRGLYEKCLRSGGEPRGMLSGAAVPVFANGRLLGAMEMGVLMNGDTGFVDRIRDSVFANETFRDKPIGTATIFMEDLRIATNVVDGEGRRAVGTRVSREVKQRVIEDGMTWTGQAWVVGARYLSRYDPIRDPDGRVIGMLYMGELEDRYLDIRKRTVLNVLGIILGGMLLAMGMAWLIARTVLEPVHRLSLATQKLSGGDLSTRVDVYGRDEIGRLAGSFNHMAARLDERERMLRQKQQELEDVNLQLKATNRNYMEMLGFVSHELKNPLASAILSLHTVKDGYLGELNEAQAKSLNSVAGSLDYFNDMIKNYLDLSRLEKGELEARKTDLDLPRDVVEPILSSLESEMGHKKISLENRLPETLAVRADRDLLRIVYDNLISNAVKYGREGGSIRLEAETRPDGVVMSVYNEGNGIPADKLSLLFKKFSRIESPAQEGKKGTGLGLFICREIMEKHGGRIWAESEEGRSATFFFQLPPADKKTEA
jgi:two-component system NtrC family sensor kinase